MCHTSIPAEFTNTNIKEVFLYGIINYLLNYLYCEMNFSRLTTITSFSNCVPQFRIMFYSNSIQLTSSLFSLLWMWIVTRLVLHRSIALLMLSPLTLFSAVPNFAAWVITCQLLSLSDNNPRILLVPLCVCIFMDGSVFLTDRT